MIAKSSLRDFWRLNPSARASLETWYRVALAAKWECFADVKAATPSVDLVSSNRLCFNIGGNKYRLITVVDFVRHGLLIRFVGTHAEYNTIDARTI